MVYLLYGEERYLLENKIKRIKKEFGELIQGINYIQIGETEIDNIISDIETPPFGYKCFHHSLRCRSPSSNPCLCRHL